MLWPSPRRSASLGREQENTERRPERRRWRVALEWRLSWFFLTHLSLIPFPFRSAPTLLFAFYPSCLVWLGFCSAVSLALSSLGRAVSRYSLPPRVVRITQFPVVTKQSGGGNWLSRASLLLLTSSRTSVAAQLATLQAREETQHHRRENVIKPSSLPGGGQEAESLPVLGASASFTFVPPWSSRLWNSTDHSQD